MDRLHELPGAGAVLPGVFDILSRGGRTKTLEDLCSGGLAAGAALIREYAGADEEKKKIISEIFRRLAVDVKDELMKAAGAGVRRAGARGACFRSSFLSGPDPASYLHTLERSFSHAISP